MRHAILSLVATAAIAAPSAAFAEVSPLVDTAWLSENAGNENVVVLDIRADVAGTDLGENPYPANAVAAPYGEAGWRTEIDGVPGKIPAVEDITALIESLGIENDDHVVILPWGTNSSEIGSATRVYWTFKYLGHEDVSILDGGWRQYDANGGARVAKPVSLEASTFEVNLQEDLLATTEEVQAALDDGTALVDGRPPEQFRGESKSGVVATAGTLPGAVNIPHFEIYSEEYARFSDSETVAALADAVNLGSDQANIAFCNTGHWATVAWFGLSEILGNKNTSMYDGSMSEWASDPDRPIQ